MSSQDSAPTVAGPPSNGETNGKALGQRLHDFLVPGPKLGPPINPALLKREGSARRRGRTGSRTRSGFAGSMLFVYVHVIWFGCWIGFGVEDYPYGLLTMIVSLEAIFLSTFVLISQNRADARRQVIADQQWRTVQEEDKQNVELLDLSRQILTLTKEVRALADSQQAAAGRRRRTDPATEGLSRGGSSEPRSPEPVGGHGDTPPRSIPGMSLQDLVLRAAVIYDSGLPPASRDRSPGMRDDRLTQPAPKLPRS